MIIDFRPRSGVVSARKAGVLDRLREFERMFHEKYYSFDHLALFRCPLPRHITVLD